MKRPILIVLIGYLIGIIWELYFERSMAPFIIICVIILLYISIFGGVRSHRALIGRVNKKTMLIFFISILISNYTTSYLNKKYNNLYNNLTGDSIYIGTIISEGEKGEHKTTYNIEIESVNGDTKYKRTRLILNISNKYNINLQYGDQIKFKGIYTKPEIQRNYQGFDYSSYLKTLKIYGTITYSGEGIKELKTSNLNSIKMITHKISISIEKNINKLFEKEEADLLIGILLGKSSNIDEEIKENFRNSGLYHILAVSGNHMSYVVLGITYLLNKINISRGKKNILKIVGIIFFMMIASSSVSVIRAGIMGSILIGAEIFYKKSDVINSICLSMLIILIDNPFNINSISFQLSYGGVIGIVTLNKIYSNILFRIKLKEKFIKVSSVILAAQTMIIPILISNFHTISFSFLISNFFAVFFIGGIIILGFSIVIVSFISLKISCVFVIFEKILLKGITLIAMVCGNMPFSKIYVTSPSGVSVVLYYIILFILYMETVYRATTTNKEDSNIEESYKYSGRATLDFTDESERKTLLCRYRKYFIRILIIVLIISLVLNNIPILSRNLRIYFIDVGQGDSTLIITPNNRKILIDGGGSDNSGNYNVGKDTLLPYLLNRGVKSLDYVIVSHFDTDHVRWGFICNE